jgi:predicted extracellular nuclease
MVVGRGIGVGICALFLLLATSCLSRASYTIKGQVLDSAGKAVSGVSITLVDSGIAEATSDSSGNYVLGNVPFGSYRIVGSKSGYMIVPRGRGGAPTGPMVTPDSGGNVVDFACLAPGEVTISMIQGTGFTSPLVDLEVSGIVGVVTQVTRRAPHAIYDTVLTDGTTTPQWVSEDGFYMECLSADKDGDPATSDGIFVYTHDEDFTESKWINGVPTDLEPGDVVSVSGEVVEYKPQDRFGSSEGFLTVTRIVADHADHVLKNGADVTAAFPAGVLLTYADSPVLPSGVTEHRTMPWQQSGKLSLRDAELVLESVEGMVVRVDNPVVTGCTYYNVTGLMADNATKGAVNANFNATWGGMVLQDPAAGGMDFNSELLFCDYQKPSWVTFRPIPQVGDLIKDSTGAFVLRGVMDYTADAVYMIKPLQFTAAEPQDASSNTIPSQGWDFDVFAGNVAMAANFKGITSAMVKAGGAIYNWRIGASRDARFAPGWSTAASGSTDTHLTVGSFNLENFEEQGGSFARQNDIAAIVVNNMRCPDVITVVEMGDDKASTIVYANQAGSYAIEDGVVSAVLNFQAIIKAILSAGGPQYDFRCIDPEENKDGGEPGTNIRVGFLFRTDRVQFVDRGLPTNTYAATNGKAASTWPVTYPSTLATALATTSTAVTRDPTDGSPALTQSPGRILAPSFNSAVRKPLAGEFIFTPTNGKFFVIAAHLSSKSGDTSLYGDQQPPVFGSDPRRAAQGAAIKAFADTILARDRNAAIIVGGDMNDFPWSDALKAMSGEGTSSRSLYSPSREFMPANEQFSYSFRGNFQQIDHLLFSPRLYSAAVAAGAKADYTGTVFISHIDSPFSKNNHVQNSDHDAIVMRVDMGY